MTLNVNVVFRTSVLQHRGTAGSARSGSLSDITMKVLFLQHIIRVAAGPPLHLTEVIINSAFFNLFMFFFFYFPLHFG